MMVPTCCERAMTGIEILGVYDGVAFWACPACGYGRHRFKAGDPRRLRLERAMATWASSPQLGEPE